MKPKLDSSVIKRTLRGKSVPAKNFQENHTESDSDDYQKLKSALSHFSKDNSPSEKNKEPLQPIITVYKELDDVVSNLDSKIIDMVKKQSGDFVQAHLLEMMKRRRDLQQAKTKYEESLAQINRDAKIKGLEKELQFYRDEAIKLAKLLDEAKNVIKDLKGQIRTLNNDKEFLSNYIKHKQTKIVTAKTEQHIDEPTPAPGVIKRPVSGRTTPDKRSVRERSPLDVSGLKERKLVLSPPMEMMTIDEIVDAECVALEPAENKVEPFLTAFEEKPLKAKISDREAEMYQVTVASYEKQLQDMKKLFLREKMRNDEMMRSKNGEMTSILDFFSSCVNNVKKNVAKRKMMVKVGGGGTSRKNMNRTGGWTNFIEDTSGVALEDFSANDQQKVLEAFVSHQPVVEAMKNLLSQAKKIYENAGIFDEKVIKQKYTSFISDNSTLNFASGDKTDAGTSFDTNVSFELKPTRPKTATAAGNFADSKDLPKIVESDMEASKTKDFLLLDPRVIDMKFAQLNESKDVPVYKPQVVTRVRRLSQNHHNYQI